MPRRRSFRVSPVVLAALCACATPDPFVEDPQRGVAYEVPAGWSAFDGELRSADGSLIALRVFELTGADRSFVAGLPDTILPQLENWARTYFVVEGPPERRETTLGGVPALEVSYRTRVRAGDPPSKLTDWIARNGTRLYVARATYAPKALEQDEAAVRRLLASWRFLETGAEGGGEAPIPGS